MNKFITCAKCHHIDVTTPPVWQGSMLIKPGHTGTSSKMACPDCSDSTDPRAKAMLCRHCCPTGHQTRWLGNPITRNEKIAVGVGLLVVAGAVTYFATRSTPANPPVKTPGNPTPPLPPPPPFIPPTKVDTILSGSNDGQTIHLVEAQPIIEVQLLLTPAIDRYAVTVSGDHVVVTPLTPTPLNNGSVATHYWKIVTIGQETLTYQPLDVSGNSAGPAINFIINVT